jgi:hypothetical protein
VNAHVLGFSWNLTGGYADQISLDELLKQMQSLRDNEFDFGGYQRLIYAGSTPTYITGLLLTAKSNKRFCELQRQGKSLRINVREAEKGSSLIDFNFFLIDRTTARGFYQYYHNSCNARIFSRLIAEQFGKIAALKTAEEINRKGGTKACPDKEQDQIREKYSGDVTCELHVRKEKFNEIVRQMQKISYFEFTLATLEPENATWYRMLSGVSRILRHHVGFKRSTTVSERAKAVVNFINSGAASDASVRGVDEDGLEKLVSLANNPDSFGHWKFDEIAAEMTFEPRDFEKSKFIQTMMALAEEHKDFLHKKAK